MRKSRKKTYPKKCKVCKESKDRQCFTNGAQDKTMMTCKMCRSLIAKKYRMENNEEQRKIDRKNYQKRKKEILDYNRKYRKKYPEKARAINWKSKYGITSEQFYEKLKLQENKCAICDIDMNEYGKIFGVDHDHKTGVVRGLLCRPCNYGLGYYEKHKDQYIDYLIKYPM